MRTVDRIPWEFVIVATTYATAAHLYASHRGLRHSLVVLAHAVPTLAAVCIALVVWWSAEEPRDYWGIRSVQGHFGAWCCLLLLAAGAVHTIASVVLATNKARRPWLLLTLPGTVVCVLGAWTCVGLVVTC